MVRHIPAANDIMDVEVIFWRLLTALGCGFLIGLERGWHHKSAGLRTNSLVAVGAALFVMLSVHLTRNTPSDVNHTVGQVIVGIGFLCAGVIVHRGLSIQGLTTAATVWCSAAIGASAGAGWWSIAAMGTGFILFVNTAVLSLDNLLERREETLKRDNS